MALSKDLKARVNAGDAHWVTIKEGPLEGRHLLIGGPRPEPGKVSRGEILAGHGIPAHVVQKITGATHAHHLDHEDADHDEKTGEPVTGKQPEQPKAEEKPKKEKPVSSQFPKWQTRMGNDFLSRAHFVMGEDKAKSKELEQILNHQGYDKAMEFVDQNHNTIRPDLKDVNMHDLQYHANQGKKKGEGTGQPYQKPEKKRGTGITPNQGPPAPPQSTPFNPVEGKSADVKFINPSSVTNHETRAKLESELKDMQTNTRKETGRENLGYARVIRTNGRTIGHIEDHNFSHAGSYAVAHLNNGHMIVGKNQKELRAKLANHPFVVMHSERGESKAPKAPKLSANEKKASKIKAEADKHLDTLEKLHRQGYLNDRLAWEAKETHRQAHNYAERMTHREPGEETGDETSAGYRVQELKDMAERHSKDHQRASKLIAEAQKHAKTIRDYNEHVSQTHGEQARYHMADTEAVKDAERNGEALQQHLNSNERVDRGVIDAHMTYLDRAVRRAKEEAKWAKSKMNKSTGELLVYKGRLIKRG